jgi:hypothetical protein
VRVDHINSSTSSSFDHGRLTDHHTRQWVRSNQQREGGDVAEGSSSNEGHWSITKNFEEHQSTMNAWKMNE